MSEQDRQSSPESAYGPDVIRFQAHNLLEGFYNLNDRGPLKATTWVSLHEDTDTSYKISGTRSKDGKYEDVLIKVKTPKGESTKYHIDCLAELSEQEIQNAYNLVQKMACVFYASLTDIIYKATPSTH